MSIKAQYTFLLLVKCGFTLKIMNWMTQDWRTWINITSSITPIMHVKEAKAKEWMIFLFIHSTLNLCMSGQIIINISITKLRIICYYYNKSGMNDFYTQATTLHSCFHVQCEQTTWSWHTFNQHRRSLSFDWKRENQHVQFSSGWFLADAHNNTRNQVVTNCSQFPKMTRFLHTRVVDSIFCLLI